MIDITKCYDDKCPMRDKCYRFTSEADELQSYFLKSPREGDKCDYLYTRTKHKDTYKLKIKI